MVETASDLLKVDQEALLDELQEVHKLYHDSEYPFALLETRLIKERFPKLSRLELKQQLDPAFRAFNETRDRTLELYPTVLATLQTLQRSGATIVGHTEASAPNAFFRLRKLGCWQYVSRLYALEHIGEDHPIVEKSMRFHEERDRVHFLRADQRKPNRDILLTICSEYNIPPSRALYIGDSITKDIGMANDAGTCSALAEYGLAFEKSLWNKLVRVTHWTQEDIRRNEEARRSYGNAKPDVVLKNSLAEILSHFEFGPP